MSKLSSEKQQRNNANLENSHRFVLCFCIHTLYIYSKNQQLKFPSISPYSAVLPLPFSRNMQGVRPFGPKHAAMRG